MAVQPDHVSLAVYGQFGAIWAAINEMECWRLVAWVRMVEVGVVLTGAGASSGVNAVTGSGHLGARRCRACACAYMAILLESGDSIRPVSPPRNRVQNA